MKGKGRREERGWRGRKDGTELYNAAENQ